MLQQTQVVTVIPYYERWLKNFPNLTSLARAPLSKVLKHWAGLGYYRRARMLHKAAQWIQSELNGEVPLTADALLKLPGIGRYTAGAIASIAFGQKTPVLDGNVIRILTRIFGIPQSIDLQTTVEKLWKVATSILPDKTPGDFNQALMELGATVCFPSAPQCPKCPAKTFCAAHQKSKETFYPVRSRIEKYEKIHMTALILLNERREVWVEKQPEHGRWGGLWTFPFWRTKEEMLRHAKSHGAQPIHFMTLQHGFTKYRIRLEVFEAVIRRKQHRQTHHKRWIPLIGLREMAFPSPHRKIVENLLQSSLFPKREL